VIAAYLGHRETVAIAVGYLPYPLEELHDVGMRLVVKVLLEVERPVPLTSASSGRIIAQLRVVHREVDRIDAETVDPSIQPEARDVQQRILHRWIMDVEIRLSRQEVVKIILAAPRIPRPCRPAEYGLPVVWWRAVRLGTAVATRSNTKRNFRRECAWSRGRR